MAEDYTYRALSPGRNTRVLDLQSNGDRDAPLQCNLREVSLDAYREIEKERYHSRDSFQRSSGHKIMPTTQAHIKYPLPDGASPPIDDGAAAISTEGQKPDGALGPHRYRALSYVWGSGMRSHALGCEGKKIFVTENCDRALRDLRDDTAPITLWVDAICINQKDPDERAQQVSLMSEIYRYADEVLIWLGEGSESMAYCFSLVPILKPMVFKYFTKGLSVDEIVDLCSKKWTTRIWTVQEFYFAYKTVIVCGKSKVSADIFYEWICIVEKTAGASENSLWAKQGSDAWQLFFLLALGSAVLISLTNNCGNPRDKIYGIYSLLPGCINELPDINYKRDEFRLYEDFTRATILTSGAFWPAALPISANHNPNLPSWVPNFSLELDDDALTKSENNHPFQATGIGLHHSQNTAEILPAAEHGTFALKGELLAHIVELDRKWPKRVEEWGNRFLSWITFFLARYTESPGTARTHTPYQAFFRLLFNSLLSSVADEDDLDEEDEEDDEDDEARLAHAKRAFPSVVQWFVDAGQVQRNQAGLLTKWRHQSQAGTVANFLCFVYEQVGGSTLFQMNTGNFGNGFGNVKQHDAIALLTDCDFPVILRKDRGNWRLIGRARVLEIETGPAWRQRVQLSEMQTFVLA
ncbi:uncharacterized protein PAC_15424 [Phialocephala subalpina]|uniref:Heterokaryon incompatibility domain-containing protein n=1 Tax=Phialocephala subalpina TaxID=576137 RepID=A0A1L7XKI7_9HELO|nr:uncharacterized protein PAC_15424 [Phialocephala subalpina]